MESYLKRKRVLEEKYGKLINVKPFNDDIGIVDTTQQKYSKQITDITDEEGFERAYDYISIIINYLSQGQRTGQVTPLTI